MLDAFARALSNGQARNFEQYVDQLRQQNPAYGWPSDNGVTAKAGKFYVATEDPRVKTIMRRYLMQHLKDNNDDYFVIHTVSNGQTDVYDTGSTNDELPAPRIPNIRRVEVGTYGTAGNPNTLRMAIKVNFIR
jgi:hypothetical protein